MISESQKEKNRDRKTFMPSKLLGAFLSLGIFYQRLVSASAYYNNEFFTRITRDEVNSLWTNEVDAHSFLADPYTCEIVLRYA